uniref:Mitochondrial inner membrane protease subunit n=1 Tax=Phallusia mammillata TaxID=59560 RepID=A0A6F9DEG1_9ASCI|nr:mitochondrial inner membrane protease subunit 1-like [Phallusia mammillata]
MVIWKQIVLLYKRTVNFGARNIRKLSIDTTAKHSAGKWSSNILPILTGACILVYVDKYYISLTLVTGSSMQPTINPDSTSQRDIVMLDRTPITTRDYSQIQRGNIITFRSPRNPNDINIKRVIGLEGDTVRTLGYKNKLVLVPPGHCWVEGDNNRSSDDSNKFGPISLGLVIGLATRIVFPLGRWQKLERKFPHSRVKTSTYCDMEQLRHLPPVLFSEVKSDSHD